MSSGPVRRVSRQDIQLVQNLIERCLQLYMTRKEVMETLLLQAKIEPDFTELVWQKLEEENPEFFNAYYLRLMLKHQIIEFNKLLEQQVQLMHQMYPTGVSPISTSNGTHIPQMHPHSACYAPDPPSITVKPENIQLPEDPSLNDVFMNGGTPLQPSMHSAMVISAHANRVSAQPNMIASQGSNIDLMHGVNGEIIKTETDYSGASLYMFGAESHVLEARSTIGDASGASFSSVESTSQPLNEPLLDADTSSFGFLGQIPRNFSLSDLTADFSQSSDILESYPRSPFLPTDADHFLEARERVEQGETGRLDPISEGLSYEDFGSE
ncbi:hypothetical protein SAY86_027266 [Trapa natans]|uniref:Angiotensin-converting enzyme 2 n=1 Tax=Trapa natans TaxID=22666 RepID=A0AAN7KTI8_TRANT|nr:hypothetical protein SAY86_027266 [Trapa natans]